MGGRTWWVAIVDAERHSTCDAPYSVRSRLHVDEGDSGSSWQRSRVDPYSRPLLTEVECTIGFEDRSRQFRDHETLD